MEHLSIPTNELRSFRHCSRPANQKITHLTIIIAQILLDNALANEKWHHPHINWVSVSLSFTEIQDFPWKT